MKRNSAIPFPTDENWALIASSLPSDLLLVGDVVNRLTSDDQSTKLISTSQLSTPHSNASSAYDDDDEEEEEESTSSMVVIPVSSTSGGNVSLLLVLVVLLVSPTTPGCCSVTLLLVNSMTASISPTPPLL